MSPFLIRPEYVISFISALTFKLTVILVANLSSHRRASSKVSITYLDPRFRITDPERYLALDRQPQDLPPAPPRVGPLTRFTWNPRYLAGRGYYWFNPSGVFLPQT